MASDDQKLDRILELAERNAAAIGALTTTVDTLTTTVTKLAATVETGFVAAAEDVERLDGKTEGNHEEMLAKFSGLERRLDAEAMQRQDLQLPQRVAAIEAHLGLARSISA